MKASKRAKRQATGLLRLCLVNGSLQADRITQVVRRLSAARPRGYLDTLSFFQKLVQLHDASRTAKIESAVRFPNELRAGLVKALERIYGPGLNTSFVENHALIGGTRIQVGSDVYDVSVRGRLTALGRGLGGKG